jgi:succinate dehydrogenase / fumarate reductase cytochrome b subunit
MTSATNPVKEKEKNGGRCPLALFSSSIGRKGVVALTGILLILFVIGHLLGNLTFYGGPDWINAYAEHLQGLGIFLWLIRIVLLAIVGTHILFTIRLWQENRRATPAKYSIKAGLGTTVSARWMRLSGLTLLAFIVFHIVDLTWQGLHPETRSWIDSQGRHDVFRLMVFDFSCPVVSGFYIIAVGLLAMHLSHGIASLFQTLGLTTGKMRPRYEFAARVIGWLLFAGFASIPASVLFGIVRLPACRASAVCPFCH